MGPYIFEPIEKPFSQCFISYRYTGEDEIKLARKLGQVVYAVKKIRMTNAYCNLFDPKMQPEDNPEVQNYGPRDYLFSAFAEIKKSDALLAFITSNEKSEGMLMEVGFAIAHNIPITVAIHESVTQTYLPELATISFRWASYDDLIHKIPKLLAIKGRINDT